MVNLAGATFYPHCDCLKMICRHASLIGMGQPHLELVATAGLDICLLLLQHSLCQKMCMSLKPIDRPPPLQQHSSDHLIRSICCTDVQVQPTARGMAAMLTDYGRGSVGTKCKNIMPLLLAADLLLLY